MIRDTTKEDLDRAAAAAKTAAHSLAKDGQDAAQDVAGQIKDEATSVSQSAINKASDLMSATTDRAKEVALAASARVEETIASAQDSIADHGHKFAQSLRDVASDRGAGVQGRVLDAVAGGVDTVAESVRGRSVSDLYADVQTFARRNPGAFAAGAAVLGFAVARYLSSNNSSGYDNSRSRENRS